MLVGGDFAPHTPGAKYNRLPLDNRPRYTLVQRVRAMPCLHPCHPARGVILRNKTIINRGIQTGLCCDVCQRGMGFVTAAPCCPARLRHRRRPRHFRRPAAFRRGSPCASRVGGSLRLRALAASAPPRPLPPTPLPRARHSRPQGVGACRHLSGRQRPHTRPERKKQPHTGQQGAALRRVTTRRRGAKTALLDTIRNNK